jgi:hypothetical protein
MNLVSRCSDLFPEELIRNAKWVLLRLAKTETLLKVIRIFMRFVCD